MIAFSRCRLPAALMLPLLAVATTAAVAVAVAAAAPVATQGRESPGPPAAQEAGGGDLTLGDALALALENSPRLAFFDLERRARDALALQAARRPNPELALQAENFGGSGGLSGLGGAELTLSLAQLFELGGKPAGRAEVATLAAELADWDYATVRLEVLSEVTRAFVQVVAAQRQIELAGDLVEVARQDLEAVGKRVAAGAASPVELIRARVALSTAQIAREAAAQGLVAARARLAATWGDGASSFGSAVGDLDRTSAPPDLADLAVRLAANPDLARWRTEVAERRASLALARARGRIDLTAEAGFRRLAETGDHAFVAGVSVPLLVNDRNQGNVAAAELRVDQAEKERRAGFAAASAELAASHAELTAAYGAAQSLRDAVLPDAREAMAAAESAYLKGLFSYTDVLAVRATYFELRGRYIESLVRYHTAAAEIARLVAGPIPGGEREQERP